MGSAVGVLSGVTVLAVLVGHASESRGSRRDGCRGSWSGGLGNRSGGDWSRGGADWRSGNADGVFADSWVIVSSLTVGIGAATESWNRGRWCWSDTDVVLASVAGTTISTIGVCLTSESVDGAVVVGDWCSRGKSSECYQGER